MKLARTLVVLDVEATGTWVEKDRIIEIALVKLEPSGSKTIFHKRVNPGMKIPPVVTELTGISDADVEGKPVFKQFANEILNFIGDADLGGFNIERFDLPLIEREFEDAGIRFEWKNRKIYDAQKVYHLNEKRDLSAAVQFYCGKKLEDAHSALADTEAVVEVLEHQVKKYGEGSRDLSALDKFEYTAAGEFYGNERKFCWWNGQLYLVFGKYARKLPLEQIVKTDSGYLTWVLKSDFSEHVKTVIRNAMRGEFPKCPQSSKGSVSSEVSAG